MTVSCTVVTLSHRQSVSLQYQDRLNIASVLVPATRGVSGTRFCEDDTHTQTHKLKTIPADPVREAERIHCSEIKCYETETKHIGSLVKSTVCISSYNTV